MLNVIIGYILMMLIFGSIGGAILGPQGFGFGAVVGALFFISVQLLDITDELREINKNMKSNNSRPIENESQAKK